MDPISVTSSHPDIALILQDMADGVMVIQKDGIISYLNARAKRILDVGEQAVGKTPAELFVEEEENEHFVQNILDAVYNKGMKQKQMLPFYHDGVRRILELSTTYLVEQSSLIMVFTDVTEREQILKRRHDSSVFISVLFTVVCLSVLLFELLDMTIPGVIPPNIYTIIVEVIAAVGVWIVFRLNGYTPRDLNLHNKGFKKNLPMVLILLAAAIAAMCGMKALLLALGVPLFEEGSGFLNFDHWTLSSTLYPLTVLYQEIMSRSVAQVRLKDLFDGKNQVLLSVLISSLIFAVIHISYGFPMMIGAFLLLSVFGFLYEKLGNIWLMCIIHYTLGTFANLLNFI